VETVCPFCACALELSGTPEPRLPRTRLGRSATFAFGASLLSAAGVTACKDNTPPALVVPETAAPIYGAPPAPPDAAVASPSSGAGSSNGGAGGVASVASSGTGGAAVVRHPAPIYGGPPPHPSGKPPSELQKRVLDDP
jgi:hypothetical protein